MQVFDAKVTEDGRPYIVMPYYPQPNLLVRARRSHFSIADVLRVGIQIGSAVETSHRRGVLHRDIKPQNILTDSYGEPALTDFGIATTTGGDGPEGLSVPWSPPEILLGTAPGDKRSDVYSLGATLWHLLVGGLPLSQGAGRRQQELRAERPDQIGPRCRARSAPIFLAWSGCSGRPMAKDPAARPQTAMELDPGPAIGRAGDAAAAHQPHCARRLVCPGRHGQGRHRDAPARSLWGGRGNRHPCPGPHPA